MFGRVVRCSDKLQVTHYRVLGHLNIDNVIGAKSAEKGKAPKEVSIAIDITSQLMLQYRYTVSLIDSTDTFPGP